MSDAYQYVTETGVIVPDTSDLLATVQAEFKEAFGQDLVVTPDTPQGVLITAETLARDAIVRNNAALANQINPDMAGGVFLDAIWALTGGARIQATKSVITGAVLNGVPGTIVPAGSQARVGATGPIFELAGDVLIQPNGTTTGNFQSLEDGPVAAPVGDLDTIASGVLGWEGVTNPTAAVLGLAQESDMAARRRRRATLALQSVSLPESMVSGLFTVAGVTDVHFEENTTPNPLNLGPITLEPHSVLAVVTGGLDADVAAELWRRKSLGAGWNGDTTVNVLDPITGQSYPVKFERPAAVPIYVQVTVQQRTFVGDPSPVVRQAILDYAAGLIPGEGGFGIGEDVSPFELAGAITAAAPALYVKSVLIGTDPGALSASVVPINIIQQATIIAGAIGVIVE